MLSLKIKIYTDKNVKSHTLALAVRIRSITLATYSHIRVSIVLAFHFNHNSPQSPSLSTVYSEISLKFLCYFITCCCTFSSVQNVAT